MIRLNKFLSDCGVASRRKSEELILQGRIAVNGNIVIDLGHKIDPAKDTITYDGEPLKQEQKEYYVLNKPKGYITSTNDERGRKTVMELIRSNGAIFPVGRLDYNTTGVLVLTNDGDFTNYLTHPGNRFKREYLATLDRDLLADDKEKLLKGVFIDNKRSKFVKIQFPERKSYKIVQVFCEEGRNHFVKKMFSTLGYTVKKLHRSSFAGINVDKIPEGSYIKVTKEYLERFIQNYEH